DDAALWQPSRSHRSAITTDVSVEGVHFTRELMTPREAGYRTMAANLSDLAAMGARPVLATVALGIPEDWAVEEVLELYRGLAGGAAEAGLSIVGGDLSRAPALSVAVAAVGEVRASNVKSRAGGRPGALLALTGPLGAARAGLELAGGAASLEGEPAAQALRAFRMPRARCDEGRFLGASRNVLAMMDCSDGLSTDLDRLCSASGCGAILDRVPVAGCARELAERRGEDPRVFALGGGEDYELLVAVRPRAFAHLASRFSKRFGRELLPIGRLREQAGVVLRDGSREVPVARSGWDHFAR
ncbi:MAG TPA: thiamine-phosphate kinase, partial [Verrucomicrobiae bacterium]|nr:thiamine-phosphate kinase [Verrucomicrobiae bacterium]